MKVKLKVKKLPEEEVAIQGEYIKLDSLLKFTLAAETGGQAKMMIEDGLVKVNGETASQRGKKVRPGDTVTVPGRKLIIKGEEL